MYSPTLQIWFGSGRSTQLWCFIGSSKNGPGKFVELWITRARIARLCWNLICGCISVARDQSREPLARGMASSGHASLNATFSSLLAWCLQLEWLSFVWYWQLLCGVGRLRIVASGISWLKSWTRRRRREMSYLYTCSFKHNATYITVSEHMKTTQTSSVRDTHHHHHHHHRHYHPRISSRRKSWNKTSKP